MFGINYHNQAAGQTILLYLFLPDREEEKCQFVSNILKNKYRIYISGKEFGMKKIFINLYITIS